jgi:hypothetical protein
MAGERQGEAVCPTVTTAASLTTVILAKAGIDLHPGCSCPRDAVGGGAAVAASRPPGPTSCSAAPMSTPPGAGAATGMGRIVSRRWIPAFAGTTRGGRTLVLASLARFRERGRGHLVALPVLAGEARRGAAGGEAGCYFNPCKANTPIRSLYKLPRYNLPFSSFTEVTVLRCSPPGSCRVQTISPCSFSSATKPYGAGFGQNAFGSRETIFAESFSRGCSLDRCCYTSQP